MHFAVHSPTYDVVFRDFSTDTSAGRHFFNNARGQNRTRPTATMRTANARKPRCTHAVRAHVVREQGDLIGRIKRKHAGGSGKFVNIIPGISAPWGRGKKRICNPQISDAPLPPRVSQQLEWQIGCPTPPTRRAQPSPQHRTRSEPQRY